MGAMSGAEASLQMLLTSAERMLLTSTELLATERWLYVSPFASELDLVCLGTSMLTLVHAALQRRLLWLVGLFVAGFALEQTPTGTEPSTTPSSTTTRTASARSRSPANAAGRWTIWQR